MDECANVSVSVCNFCRYEQPFQSSSCALPVHSRHETKASMQSRVSKRSFESTCTPHNAVQAFARTCKGQAPANPHVHAPMPCERSHRETGDGGHVKLHAMNQHIVAPERAAWTSSGTHANAMCSPHTQVRCALERAVTLNNLAHQHPNNLTPTTAPWLEMCRRVPEEPEGGEGGGYGTQGPGMGASTQLLSHAPDVARIDVPLPPQPPPPPDH